MLITELKAKDALLSQISGKVFVINCHGCKEVYLFVFFKFVHFKENIQ